MSFSSKPKKVKPKGRVTELKIVQSVSRSGADTLKSEEVKTPKKNQIPAGRQSQPSSPIKRTKLFDSEAIPFILEYPLFSKKRPTLVFLFFTIYNVRDCHILFRTKMTT
jgi:hypothetical protein